MLEAVDPLLFAGQTFCDVVMSEVELPEPGGEAFASAMTVSPGGVANRAVAAARLGAATSLLTSFGDDVFGREVRRQLSSEPDLDLTHAAVVEGYRTPVSISLTGAEDRTFITYEEAAPPLLWPDAERHVRATHVNLAAELPPWLAPLRSAGTLVVAGVGWDATGDWPIEVLDRLPGVDVFVPNAVEAMRYTRTDDARTAARALAERVECVIVTCGDAGAIAISAEHGEVHVPAVPVEVVDPTGAGDVFVAAWMAVADLGWPLDQSVRAASLAAACSLRGLGGAQSAPTRRDLLTLVHEQRLSGWAPIEEWARLEATADLRTTRTTPAASVA